MHTILILGGGYVSSVLAHELSAHGSVHTVDFPEVDITNLESVEAVLQRIKPTLVINAAAWTDTNAAEKPENHSKVFALNVQGPANIALSTRRLGIPWVHFSTAMMFDGGTWTETDTPQPTGYYAWTKYWSDLLLLGTSEVDGITIFRIHTPIASLPHPRNFLNRMVSFDKAINVPTSVTLVEDVANAIVHLCLDQKPKGGLFNAVCPGSISAFEISQELQKQGLIPEDKIVGELTREELDAMTVARGGAHQTFPILDPSKLQSTGITLIPAQEAVRLTVEKFKSLYNRN